ncbi:MerR family transcriptional regulator [Catellatospora bangladeshensis]
MQIGELAALVGSSPRAIRHYHRRGLLPEPPRRSNGYRDYGLREAIALARIRRLAELGLSLDEVHDALADDRGRDLHEILVELDGDLARQEARIRDRRARLAELVARGGVRADDAVSADLAEVLRSFDGPTGAEPASPVAAAERELLALLDTTAEPAERDRVVAVLRAQADDPAAVARGQEVHRRLDELSDAPVDDPRVPPLAAELADSVPRELLAVLPPPAEFGPDHPFSAVVLDAMAPAQAEVVRRALRILADRGEGAR